MEPLLEARVTQKFDRQHLDRRTFLRRGALGAAGLAAVGAAGPTLLAACSASTTTTAPGGTTAGGAPDLGALDYQLSWLKNVEFAGQYIADQSGYYKSVGFSSVNLIAGGPNVQQDAVVNAGRALIGISAPDITGAAIKSGASLVAIAALFQKNPFCVTSLASNPIKTPQDMAGKSIGVQAVNEPVWNAFLKANSIDPASITKVPAQFDPSPLADDNAHVQGWFSFFTNEPNVLEYKGHATVSFLLNDYHYPLVSQIYITKKDNLQSKRDALKAVLKADIKGWHDSIKDPVAGSKLAVEVYGKDQGNNVEEQTLESKAQNSLIVTDDTKTNGIMTVTDELMKETIDTLKLVDIDGSKMFDLSLLAEVYKENPDLKPIPS
jgi:ABC-type nitrate/sulfonate/bicarbonate transport system substrate-binding protein